MLQEAIRLYNPNAAAYAVSANQRQHPTSNFVLMNANKTKLGTALQSIYAAG
jgi:hypothetical protein